jgi:HlyD family secretion protein
MKSLQNLILFAGFGLMTIGCGQNDEFDASGAFEAVETIISSEATGVIRQLDLSEGEELQPGQFIGFVDSTQVYLKKQQLLSQIEALLVKRPDIPVQLAHLEEQLRAAEKERTRMANLREGNAATEKQLDDITAQTEVLTRQLQAQKSSLRIAYEGIDRDIKPLQIQVTQLEDQLKRHRIDNPVKGTVLTKYAESSEVTTPGKPLYKIADLSTMVLRVYITGNQLARIRLNQKVRVFTDDGQGGYKETEGVVSWISDKAEFTPKAIQTKDERASRVYAVKVRVVNDGTYKIGMYGEIRFDKDA